MSQLPPVIPGVVNCETSNCGFVKTVYNFSNDNELTDGLRQTYLHFSSISAGCYWPSQYALQLSNRYRGVPPKRSHRICTNPKGPPGRGWGGLDPRTPLASYAPECCVFFWVHSTQTRDKVGTVPSGQSNAALCLNLQL